MPPARSSRTSDTASSTSGMPAETVTPSIGRPAATARCTRRREPMCMPHRYGSRNMVLNCAEAPSSRSSCRRETLSLKISGVTWPPPASSAQKPALAAAATMAGSTVVGVMPPSRIGERPVASVNLVSTRARPSRVTRRGMWTDQVCGAAGALPGSNSSAWPWSSATATTPTPVPAVSARVSGATPSPGPISRIHSAPASMTEATSAGQSMAAVSTCSAIGRAKASSMPTAAASSRVSSTAAAMSGWWKPAPTGSGEQVGAKAAPPRSFAVSSAASFLAARPRFSSVARRSAGVPTTTHIERPLRRPTTASPARCGVTSSGRTPETIIMGYWEPAAAEPDPAPLPSREVMPVTRPRRATATPMISASATTSPARSGCWAAATPRTPWEWPMAATALDASTPWAASRSSTAICATRMPGTEMAGASRSGRPATAVEAAEAFFSACLSPSSASASAAGLEAAAWAAPAFSAHSKGVKPSGRWPARRSATGARRCSAWATSSRTRPSTPAATQVVRVSSQG